MLFSVNIIHNSQINKRLYLSISNWQVPNFDQLYPEEAKLVQNWSQGC